MTETTAPSRQHEATVERYLRFWNAGTPEEQQRLAATTFTDDIEYHAPVGVLAGRQALIDFRDRFAQHMGTVAFRSREEPQIHHDRARLRWEIEVGAEPFAAGTDVLAFDPDGRISSVSAFLDRAPEGFDPHAHD
ncbi:nuclear transport factor 2 family protein [Micromonospora echinaurantiaca]|uniref:nuclear transport factor 2 family protein n=1 Tax=Micromonospora echinaurantiaca TaxID=47857 RepID=UPI0037B1938E